MAAIRWQTEERKLGGGKERGGRKERIERDQIKRER